MVSKFQWQVMNATVTSTTTTTKEHCNELLTHMRALRRHLMIWSESSPPEAQTAGKSQRQGQPMAESTSTIDLGLVVKRVAFGVAECLLGQPPQLQR